MIFEIMMLKRSSILLPLFTTRNLSRYAHRLASSFMIPNDKRYTNKNNGLRARYKFNFPGAEGCYNEKGRHLHQHPLMTCIMKLEYIQHIKSNNIYKSSMSYYVAMDQKNYFYHTLVVKLKPVKPS